MNKLPSIQAARVESIIRKAVANAWAGEIPVTEAVTMASQSIRQTFPEMSEAEISTAIQSVCGISK